MVICWPKIAIAVKRTFQTKYYYFPQTDHKIHICYSLERRGGIHWWVTADMKRYSDSICTNFQFEQTFPASPQPPSLVYETSFNDRVSLSILLSTFRHDTHKHRVFMHTKFIRIIILVWRLSLLISASLGQIEPVPFIRIINCGPIFVLFVFFSQNSVTRQNGMREWEWNPKKQISIDQTTACTGARTHSIRISVNTTSKYASSERSSMCPPPFEQRFRLVGMIRGCIVWRWH